MYTYVYIHTYQYIHMQLLDGNGWPVNQSERANLGSSGAQRTVHTTCAACLRREPQVDIVITALPEFTDAFTSQCAVSTRKRIHMAKRSRALESTQSSLRWEEKRGI